ncbi:MAG: hypothetical protein QOJ57_2167 [Thermoleophilaceae bacterium]|nr:hypothetical protein [Thermoleophilaceae bacterium]
MPRDEDRFGDLGGDSAADRLADLDRTEPEPDRPRPPRRREPGRSYMWVVGVAGVIAIAVVAINSLPNAGRGSSGPVPGEPIPKFAAPIALGVASEDDDPNIKQSKGDSNSPNDVPACDVRAPGAMRICDYTSKPLVITFIVPGAKDCERYLDRIQRIRPLYPRVNFVGVVSGAKKSRVDRLVRDHGWTFPVAVDKNLSLFNTYRISLCATSVFVYRGGIVRASKVEAQRYTPAQLATAIGATTLR